MAETQLNEMELILKRLQRGGKKGFRWPGLETWLNEEGQEEKHAELEGRIRVRIDKRFETQKPGREAVWRL